MKKKIEKERCMAGDFNPLRILKKNKSKLMHKSLKILLIALFFIIRSILVVFAQDNPLKISGKLSTDQRFRTAKPQTWSWNETRIDLTLSKKFEDKAKFYSNIWLRNIGFADITSLTQLYDKNQSSPLNMDLQEAYIDVNNFIFKDLNIRAGRQKFNWGTGDKLNPVNTLNPLDLEDIWDFGRYQGSDAMKLTYYLKSLKFEGIWLPFFRSSTLPIGDWADAFMTIPELPAGISLNALTNNIKMPDLSLKNSSSYGFRGSTSLGNFDLALDYTYFYDPIPSPDSNVITFAGSFTKINVNAFQQYLRLHNAGFSFSGELFNFGIWGEFSAFIPTDSLVMQTVFGTSVMDSLILDNKPWFKYLLGTDYTFKDGSYLNIQYLHGFFHEKGKANLNDYFTIAWYKKFLHDQLKITPVSGCFVVSDWKDVGNNYVFIYNPEISYMPNDNTELGIGIRIIDGKGGSMFAAVKDKDEMFFKIGYSF